MNFNPITEIFVKNIMLRSKNKLLSIMNEEDVLIIVPKAYEIMAVRTYRRDTASNAWGKINAVDKQAWFKNIAKYLVEYFKNPNIDFDDWHHATCDKILLELNNMLTKAGYKKVAYGKAQKILNASFKLLYLYDDADTFAHLFKNCHFIIDKANLNWYKSVMKKNVGTWSNLVYQDYIDIQKDIRDILKKQNKYPQNPFEAEFYIWADYQF